jgi:hypothetical protein
MLMTITNQIHMMYPVNEGVLTLEDTYGIRILIRSTSTPISNDPQLLEPQPAKSRLAATAFVAPQSLKRWVDIVKKDRCSN